MTCINTRHKILSFYVIFDEQRFVILKTKIVWILPFCSIKLFTIGIKQAGFRAPDPTQLNWQLSRVESDRNNVWVYDNFFTIVVDFQTENAGCGQQHTDKKQAS